jgi:hypothetical protein
MTKYLRHKDGAVHSFTDEQFEENYQISGNGWKGAGLPGPKTLDPDWTELTEDEAREANPQLFGAVDPAVAFCELRDNS